MKHFIIFNLRILDMNNEIQMNDFIQNNNTEIEEEVGSEGRFHFFLPKIHSKQSAGGRLSRIVENDDFNT